MVSSAHKELMHRIDRCFEIIKRVRQDNEDAMLMTDYARERQRYSHMDEAYTRVQNIYSDVFYPKVELHEYPND